MRIFLILLLTLTGCSRFPQIKDGTATVLGLPDAGKPATLDRDEQGETLLIPKGTVLQVNKLPDGTETWTWTFSEPTEFERRASRLHANTGTVDTSVALRRADNEERRPLLYLAGGLFALGILIGVVLKYPVIGGMIALLGGGGALAAWKFAGLPDWTWIVGIAFAFVAFAFYTRGQWDKNGDLIPDRLQK